MYKSIDDRKQKWRRFMNGVGNERTMYLILTGMDAEKAADRPLPQPSLVEERVAWAYENYNYSMERMEWLPDDRIPHLSPYTGTEIFAEAFGCKVQYPDDNMPFAIPMDKTIGEAAALKVPNVHDTPLDYLFEIGRRLQQKAGPEAILHLPDAQSPLDIAALLIDKAEFYVAMLEAPQAVHEIAEKAKMLLTAFFDEWFAEFGTEYIAHYPSYYMEGGMTLSEDEVGAFSSDMFNEYVLGALNELSDKYGGIGIHSCADSEHQWQNFRNVKGLRMLNLCNNSDFIERSTRFFGNTVAQWPIAGMPAMDGEAPQWLATCPADARVVLTYMAQDRSAALETARRAEELSQCRSRKEA